MDRAAARTTSVVGAGAEATLYGVSCAVSPLAYCAMEAVHYYALQSPSSAHFQPNALLTDVSSLSLLCARHLAHNFDRYAASFFVELALVDVGRHS